jgi:hypothetical protein
MSNMCPIPAVRDLTATAAELNLLDGVSGLVQADLTKLAAIEATAAEVAMAADVSTFLGTYTATSPAAIPATIRVIELNHASTAIEKTIASMVPYAGQIVCVKDISATGTAAHTVTITTGTWNGTNKVITLNALNECLVVAVDSAGNGTVLVNIGEVALSG